MSHIPRLVYRVSFRIIYCGRAGSKGSFDLNTRALSRSRRAACRDKDEFAEKAPRLFEPAGCSYSRSSTVLLHVKPNTIGLMKSDFHAITSFRGQAGKIF